MKEITWVNPNRMLMETGHKTFDRQTDLVFTGNIIANTQLAYYVRGALNVTCYGPKEYAQGHLRDYDLEHWPKMPKRVRAYIVEQTDNTDKSIWVCELFHYNGRRRIVHGYIVTKKDHTLLRSFVTGPTYKSFRVIHGVMPYVANIPEA